LNADSSHFNADSRHLNADSCHFNADYTGVNLTVMDEDFNVVTTPTIVLKFIDFDFVTYNERPIKDVAAWL